MYGLAMARPYRGTSLPRHVPSGHVPAASPSADMYGLAMARPYRGMPLPRHSPTAACPYLGTSPPHCHLRICTDLPWHVPTAACPFRARPYRLAICAYVRTCHGKSLPRHVPSGHVPTASPSADMYGLAMARPYRGMPLPGTFLPPRHLRICTALSASLLKPAFARLFEVRMPSLILLLPLPHHPSSSSLACFERQPPCRLPVLL